MMSMMYQAYQNHMDLTAPWRTGASAALKYLNLVPQGLSDKLFGRLTAALELISRSSLTYARPAYGIGSVMVGNRELPVTEEVIYSTPFGSLDHPFNPISVALGAEATFVARTHDMDRKHMIEMFRRAHEHRGAAFVEVYQNCNVFNDGAFDAILNKDARPDMLIDLKHGQPIRFGTEREMGVMMSEIGEAQIVRVADVGEQRIMVHDETRHDPSLAFALSRLAEHPETPTPVGVFRAVERPSYEVEMQRQLVAAAERSGPGDLSALLRSAPTWTVN